jgi:hypothetical protein
LAGAAADIAEAMEIATHGEMRLYEADCYLEYTRLYLTCRESSKKDKAHQSLATAKRMVEQMGYNRRKAEVTELEAIL